MATKDAQVVFGIAGEDLSSAYGKVIKVDGGDAERHKLADDGTDVNQLGILRNSPGDEERTEVTISGPADAYAGGAIEPFDYVASNASGLVIKAATNAIIIGQYTPALENGAYNDAASGDLIHINVFAQKRVAEA